MGKQMVRCPRDDRVAIPSAMIHLLPWHGDVDHGHFVLSCQHHSCPPKSVTVRDFDIAARRNLYGNQEARNYIGYSADELAAMGSELLSTLMHPADLARFDEHLARLDSAQDDDVLEFEYRMRHKDGSWRWFRSRDAVFDRSSAGRPTSIVGVATEITERKNHEQALRRNEDRHRALIAHASQTIWIADAGGKVLEAGAWLETFTGDAGPVDRDGEWWLPHVHPDDRWQIRMARDRALRDREPFAVQVRVRRRDGEFGWLALRGVPLFEQDGTLREWVGTLQDVTAQKRAAEAIIASEKHLRRVLDSLFIFVGVLTPEGTLIEANKAPLEAAALSPEDVLGKPVWDTYWFNHSPEVQEQLRAAIDRANRGEPSRYDVDVRMAGGVMMTIDFMLVPLRDEAAQIQFLISSAVDISERNQADKTLRKQNERLRLLWETAGILFSADNPDAMIQGLFEKISDHLRIDTCLQYMANEQADALCLQFSTGVPADALPRRLVWTLARPSAAALRSLGIPSWPRSFSRRMTPGRSSSRRLACEPTPATHWSPMGKCLARSRSAAAAGTVSTMMSPSSWRRSPTT